MQLFLFMAKRRGKVSAMDQHVSEDLIDAGRSYEALFVPALFEAWTKHLMWHVELACLHVVRWRKRVQMVGSLVLILRQAC
jgi:hypothetical protein